ncbi:MAG TPA: tyrosine-protein phosphatase [Phenylobacterium sp.]
MDRHIDFEGIENFRDFGGYATASGGQVRRGVLYRSAHHAEATEADLERLRELGIQVVVDLRKAHERHRAPCRHDAYARRIIANDLGEHTDNWVESLKGIEPDADWFRNDCLTFYREAPFEERHIDLFSRWFHELAASDGAVLVHCAAGKDRTGMICALTHHIAGVHEDDILHDYLLTNDETRIARRIPALATLIEGFGGIRPTDEAVRVACSVYPEYLQIAFDRMSEECGSLDGYLEQALGVDAALREKIAARILA